MVVIITSSFDKSCVSADKDANKNPVLDEKMGGFGDAPHIYSLYFIMPMRYRYHATQIMERDIPNLGINIPIPVIERLWLLLAHYHGQTVNYHKLAGAAVVPTKQCRFKKSVTIAPA